MNSKIIELLVLAAIAIFLILRLKSVLGTRDGFENPPAENSGKSRRSRRPDFEVIDGGPDRDITDHVDDGTPAAKALAAMKMADGSFNVREFLEGARGAYEMILMAFENGDMSEVRGFIAPEVAEAFESVIATRAEQGLSVEAHFVGVREVSLVGAEYDRTSGEGDISVRFVGELTSVVRNASGDIVEGDPNEIKRQRDTWTFSRRLGSDDPNWQLVATGE